MIYIHVPFCRSFCTYCGFYSEICSRRDPQQVQNRIMEDYVDAVLDEIASRREEIAAARGLDPAKPGAAALQAPDTLYIGGGTPSVLAVPMLERIVRALGPATYVEFTVEVNPDDVAAGGASYAAALRALGVNRISMGVQSFDDDVLRWMNRRHNAAGAREAFRLLRSAGFDNVSIDLIFGMSQLSDGLWERTVDEALALHPEHISAYQLSVEPDSALAEMVASGRYTEASDERCCRQYDTLCRLLAAAGYVHYEVSNWALPGREAVHNSAYWRRVPYVGLGPSAHSLSFPSTAGTASPTAVPGVRSWNGSELARRGADGCLLRWHAEQEILSGREAAEEAIMLALRTARGIPLAQLRALSPSAPVDDLLAAGALRLIPVAAASDGPWVRIPEDRFFVSDDIISRLFPEG